MKENTNPVKRVVLFEKNVEKCSIEAERILNVILTSTPRKAGMLVVSLRDREVEFIIDKRVKNIAMNRSFKDELVLEVFKKYFNLDDEYKIYH